MAALFPVHVTAAGAAALSESWCDAMTVSAGIPAYTDSPAVPVVSPARYRWLVVRAWLVRVTGSASRCVVIGWRYSLTMITVIRLGLVWAKVCGRLNLADARTSYHAESGAAKVVVRNVPKISRIALTPHGWSQVVRLTPGQTLDDYESATPALRHAARVQTVKVRELPERPGFVEMRVLRRDPLRHVTERPRPLSTSRFVVGSAEDGQPFVVDFDTNPHLLVSGATGSGKSGFLGALLTGIAQTPALLAYWDLKWGIEAEPWRPRCTEIVTTQPEVRASTTQLLEHVGRRAELLKKVGVRSVAEAEALGLFLRRVYLVVDEVAEVALDHGHKDDDGTKLVELILPELLSIVQRVRAFGFHVVLCGQRFGSDLGPKITAIRAQVSGRVCLAVNDRQTAEMVLPGYAPEVHEAVMGINRPGLGVVADGRDWHLGRSAFQLAEEIKAVAQTTARHAITWDQLQADDQAAYDTWAVKR
jgi:S-DNA-T family DNA segregation ATPase FtsK/SpoIIIE